jgi:hypothetical protein
MPSKPCQKTSQLICFGREQKCADSVFGDRKYCKGAETLKKTNYLKKYFIYMKKLYNMTSHANKSVSEVGDKGILSRKIMRALKFMLVLLVNLLVGYTAFSCVNDSIKSFNVSGGAFLIQWPEQVRQSLERDTIRTKEEKDTDYKLVMLYWSYLDYDGKKVTYKLSKNDFLSKGKDLAAFDYDNIISNVDWLNSLLTDKDYWKNLSDAIKKWQKEAEKTGLK